jgi:HD-like signal output (HDOD) protein
MFKSIIKFLFSPAKKNNKPNYSYFEEDERSTLDNQHKTKDELTTSPTTIVESVSIEEKHQKEFYDYLFGQSPKTEQHDELSLHIANKIEALLLQPKHILENLPVLPISLAKVIEQLNDDEFNTELLIDLIQQEPVIAGKVIELANSLYYNRSNKNITNLKSAFMQLGTTGLMEGVINGFVSKLTPQSQIYFKHYGNKIWKHSLSTGVIAKELINNSSYKQDSAQGYLIGLICNLGDMIIYQLLMEAFSYVHPDCQPNSLAFKSLIIKNSKKITYHIAKHWNFPSSILDSLALQTKLTKSSMLSYAFNKRPIGCYIYEANIISELELMFEDKKIDLEVIIEEKNNLVFSNEAKKYLDDLICKELQY